jgi:hypothetical protein
MQSYQHDDHPAVCHHDVKRRKVLSRGLLPFSSVFCPDFFVAVLCLLMTFPISSLSVAAGYGVNKDERTIMANDSVSSALVEVPKNHESFRVVLVLGYDSIEEGKDDTAVALSQATSQVPRQAMS